MKRVVEKVADGAGSAGAAAEVVTDAVLQTAEVVAYGGYAASYETLYALGALPDPIEFLFLPIEIQLTMQEANLLALSAALDYLATRNITNVYNDPATGERKESDWWPDWAVELTGGDPAACYFPCTTLPGISPNEKGNGVDIDFQWPLGN